MRTSRSWSGARPLGRGSGRSWRDSFIGGIPEAGGEFTIRPCRRSGRTQDRHDPQHDRLRLRRTRHPVGHARLRAALGQPPLPRARRAPARRAARAGTGAARAHRRAHRARQARPGLRLRAPEGERRPAGRTAARCASCRELALRHDARASRRCGSSSPNCCSSPACCRRRRPIRPRCRPRRWRCWTRCSTSSSPRASARAPSWPR